MDPVYKEMSPSCWSKRFTSRDELIDHYVRFVNSGSKNAVANLKHQSGVSYGSGINEKYDVFGTDLPDDAPILAYVHGGYWHKFSRQESAYFAESFHESGIKTIVIGYDLCPNVTVAEIVDQVKRAIVSILKYASERQSRGVYLMGHSAGAQLVAKFLADRRLLLQETTAITESLRGAFLVSGVYDLMPLVDTPENDLLRLTSDEARRMSPRYDTYFHMRDLNVRLYVLVAEHESATYVRMSRTMYDMLEESCQVQNVHFRIMTGRDHFDIMETLADADNYLKRMLLDDLANDSYGPSLH